MPAFGNDVLSALEDQATVSLDGSANGQKGTRLAFTTDSFVVRPLFFPGGDIGKLAVHGTVNDLAVGGASPLFLSAAFILEEGLPLADLKRIVASMRQACDEAGVALVTGDTKVVDRGKGDQVFITTSGIGLVPEGRSLSIRNARPGDRILVSGTIGDHGIAIMSVREGIEFETVLESDSAALTDLMRVMLEACPGIRCMRDPTRGGVSSALNELAEASRVGVGCDEAAHPDPPEVKAACEMLGLDPLYVANEGKLIAVVPPEDAERVAGRDAKPSAGTERRDHRQSRRRSSRHGHHEIAGRRRAGRHHAGRRTVAANLLKLNNRSGLHSPRLGRGQSGNRGLWRTKHIRRFSSRKEPHTWPKQLGPYGRKTQKEPAVKEVHILWITAGLSCDGDSVSVTAASQPSIEDVVMGAIPGLPKVHLHNPVLAYEVGDEFMKYWYDADEDRLELRSSWSSKGRSPTRRSRSEGYWAALGTDKHTGQPITTCEWIDRLAPKAFAVVAAGTCATYGGIHAMAGNPDRRMGLADYLGWNWRSKAGLPIVNVPGCPGAAGQLHGDAALSALSGGGPGPDDSAGRAAAADLAVRQDRPRGLRPGRLLRAGRFRQRVRLAQVPGEDRLLGAGGQLQRHQARLDGRHRRLSQRRRHLHRLHHARLPRQVHAVHGRAARRQPVVDRSSACTAGSSATCAASPTTPSTRNRSGGTAAAS